MNRMLACWAVGLTLLLAGCASGPARVVGSTPAKTAGGAEGGHGASGPGVAREAYLEKELVRAESAEAGLRSIGITADVAIPNNVLGGTLEGVYRTKPGSRLEYLVALYDNGAEIDIVRYDTSETVAASIDPGKDIAAKRPFKANGLPGAAWSKGRTPEVIEPDGRTVKPGTGVIFRTSHAEWQYRNYALFVETTDTVPTGKLLQVIKDMRFDVNE